MASHKIPLRSSAETMLEIAHAGSAAFPPLRATLGLVIFVLETVDQVASYVQLIARHWLIPCSIKPIGKRSGPLAIFANVSAFNSRPVIPGICRQPRNISSRTSVPSGFPKSLSKSIGWLTTPVTIYVRYREWVLQRNGWDAKRSKRNWRGFVPVSRKSSHC